MGYTGPKKVDHLPFRYTIQNICCVLTQKMKKKIKKKGIICAIFCCKFQKSEIRKKCPRRTFSRLKGGGQWVFFVKLDFEIAVDQQTRTSDRTFEGVLDPNRQTVPAGQPRPYLVQIRPNLAKYPEHAQNPYFMCSTCS